MKTVKLNNGTILEVGKKYRVVNDEYEESCNYVYTLLCIYDKYLWMRESGGLLSNRLVNENWLPYTAPQEEVTWKTFMIETLSQKTDIPYKFFSQYYSMEDAREHHKRAISIQEVKLNIEPVNS